MSIRGIGLIRPRIGITGERCICSIEPPGSISHETDYLVKSLKKSQSPFYFVCLFLPSLTFIVVRDLKTNAIYLFIGGNYSRSGMARLLDSPSHFSKVDILREPQLNTYLKGIQKRY